ncbi:hypothetical protein THIOM_001544, partial [Candidatus Thiomargarita nelsonii]
MSKDFEDEETDMGSVNHSLAQAKLTCLLGADERFTVMTELSLDISQHDFSQYGIKAKDEVKPDICVYPGGFDFQDLDIVKMTDMPLLAIEILSQGTKELREKFYAYFELGVKSCWLVVPDIKTISVFSQPAQFKTFDMKDSEIVDEVIDIHLPIQNLFRKRSETIQQ